MCSDVAIRAIGLGKTYMLYERPVERLMEALSLGRRQYGRCFAALQDVSFEVRRGEVLGIVGRNGAGKSTLLQLVCGTLQPSTGSIEVNGRVAALLELGAGFNPEFTGRENVFMNAAILGIPETEIAARFDSIVDFSGLRDFIDQPVKTYSSGMYVRLAFSVATAFEPDILVIDEALSVGDGAFARKSFDRIMALKDQGTTILFCSHSMFHVEAICDQVLWLEGGRVRMRDVPERVTHAYGAALMAETPPIPAPKAPPLEPTPHSTATGSARLLEVRVTADGVTGRRLAVRSGVTDVTVEVRFLAAPGLPPPTLAYGLETESGIVVSSAGSGLDGVPLIQEPDGSGRATLRLPHLPLMRGIYRLTIYLACERTLHVYDQATYCAELDVSHVGLEQGLVFLPRSWNDGPILFGPTPSGGA